MIMIHKSSRWELIRLAYEVAKENNGNNDDILLEAFETKDYYAFFFCPKNYDGSGIGGEPAFVSKETLKINYSVMTSGIIEAKERTRKINVRKLEPDQPPLSGKRK